MREGIDLNSGPEVCSNASVCPAHITRHHTSRTGRDHRFGGKKLEILASGDLLASAGDKKGPGFKQRQEDREDFHGSKVDILDQKPLSIPDGSCEDSRLPFERSWLGGRHICSQKHF